MKFLKLVAIVLCVLLAAAAFAFPPMVNSHFNNTLQRPPYRVSEQAQNLHQQLVVADLHADSLL
jgi:hypothetical protein